MELNGLNPSMAHDPQEWSMSASNPWAQPSVAPKQKQKKSLDLPTKTVAYALRICFLSGVVMFLFIQLGEIGIDGQELTSDFWGPVSDISLLGLQKSLVLKQIHKVWMSPQTEVQSLSCKNQQILIHVLI